MPDALGKALQGRALGLLTMPVPGFAFSGKDRRSGTSEVAVTPGRRLRVGVYLAAAGPVPKLIII